MEVRLHIDGYPDSGDEERAELSWRLEQELQELDVEELGRPAADSPVGAKGGALEWAQLVVTLAGTLPGLVAAIQGWTARHRGAAVTLEIGGDRLTLDEASSEERRELIRAWLDRHGRG
jgi:Effector Associated Constant Component 1